MNKIIDFISNNFTPLCTLLATIIGGMISFISTSLAESRKNKKAFQREKLTDILIPYCSTIEDTISIANTIYSDYSFKLSITDYIEKLSVPLIYLKAEKRAYLSKEQIRELEIYQSKLSQLESSWDSCYTSTYNQYVHWLSNKLISFPNLAYTPMHITMNFIDSAKHQLRLSLVHKCNCSMIDSIKSVCFIHNDDPDNYRTTVVSITDEARNIFGEISYGLSDFDDISDPEISLACLFLDYISDIKDTSILNTFIDESPVADYLISLIEYLREINKNVIKQIDHITQ